jgi:hypothetical protein
LIKEMLRRSVAVDITSHHHKKDPIEHRPFLQPHHGMYSGSKTLLMTMSVQKTAKAIVNKISMARSPEGGMNNS